MSESLFNSKKTYLPSIMKQLENTSKSGIKSIQIEIVSNKNIQRYVIEN